MGENIIKTPQATSIRALIRKSPYLVRHYQVSIIKEVLSYLANNGSTIINIPQGLGKTFISQVVAVLAHKRVINQKYKILFLVPTRALAAQHVLMARWMRKHGRLLVIDQSAVKESFVLRNHFKHATYVLSTPILIENRLTSIDTTDLAKIKVCVVDEVDMFAVTDWPTIRFHKRMGPIVERLIAQGCAFIGLTASRLNPDEKVFWRDQIRFQPVTAYTKEMLRWLPFSLVEPIEVEPDNKTSILDAALRRALRASHKSLYEMGIPETLKGFHALVTKVGNGHSVRVKLGGKWVRVDGELPALQSLCLAIKAAWNAQIMLFEDTIKPFHLDGVCRALRRHLAELPPNVVSHSTRKAIADAADSLVEMVGFAASISSELTPKKSKVMELLRLHHDKKGLVFCRFIELASYLDGLAAQEYLQGQVIHGRLREREMVSRMAAFRWDSSLNIAFMTRDLGGRGLDFPDAQYLVLYSPRRDFTSVDQEICRIRSNRDDPKPIYLLYYAGTAEEPKAQGLLAKMSTAESLGGHKAYQISETSQSGQELRSSILDST